MSRAGRRARLARLEAAESVTADVAQAMFAERDEWVWRVGTRGWEIESARRRRIRTEVAATRWRSALWQNGRRAA
jgi:hypothetical protein